MVHFSEDYRGSPVAVHRHGGRRSCSHAATSGFQLSAATVEVPQMLSSTEFGRSLADSVHQVHSCAVVSTKTSLQHLIRTSTTAPPPPLSLSPHPLPPPHGMCFLEIQVFLWIQKTKGLFSGLFRRSNGVLSFEKLFLTFWKVTSGKGGEVHRSAAEKKQKQEAAAKAAQRIKSSTNDRKSNRRSRNRSTSSSNKKSNTNSRKKQQTAKAAQAAASCTNSSTNST